MENEIEKLQLLLQKDPSNFQARRELAIVLAHNGFNEEALSNLEYLNKYFSEDAELQYNLGILYEKVKDFDKAKKSYLKAIEISPQEDFYYNLGEVLVSLEEWNEAIDVFKTVLQTDPNDGNSYFNLGLCYFHKDEKNMATDFFQKAIDLNPNDIYAYFYLANIYENSGLTNFAIENYQKILAISPDYSWAYYNLASLAYKNENLEQAKEYLLKTIECNNLDIESYKLLTKICIRLAEYEEIITILESRLEKEGNGDLYYALSQVYKHVGKLEEYAKSLEKALANSLTLSYPKDIVKQEFKYLESNFQRPKEIEEQTDFVDDSFEVDEEFETDEDIDNYEENIEEI